MTDSKTLVEQAKALLEKENYDEAYRLLLEAALMDENGEAMAALGQMYYDGDGVRADYDKAGKMFGLAFENGTVEETWHLVIAGSCYEEKAKTRPEEIDMAIRCYKAAADRGLGYGYECLAELYLNRGDYEWAYECLTRPKKLNSSGLYLLGKMYEEGLYVEKDIEKSIDYYEKAVDFYIDYEDDYGHDKYCDMSKVRLKALGS